MSEVAFKAFQKIGRLTRECVVTEKIDGTNAQINIVEKCSCAAAPGDAYCGNCPTKEFIIAENDTAWMFAGSRTRYITPDADNMGFARWAQEHADELWALGPGRHFGEWWGSKIQRAYGLTERRFSLFNTTQWADRHFVGPNGTRSTGLTYVGDGAVGAMPREGQQWAPACCHVVPELYRGLFSDRVVDNMIAKLRAEGSVAAPGFMRPEGVVAFHTATGVLFKKTLEKDEAPKGLAA